MNWHRLVGQLAAGMSGELAAIERVENGYLIRFTDLRKAEQEPPSLLARSLSAAATGEAPRGPDIYRTYQRSVFYPTIEAVTETLRDADAALTRRREAIHHGAYVHPE